MVTLPVRIQKMVGKLHDIGYESLYLYSGSSPNGMNWRYTIGIINNKKWPTNDYLVEGSIRSSGAIEWSESDATVEKLADNFEQYYADSLILAKVKIRILLIGTKN